MKDERKTKTQLISELQSCRQKLASLSHNEERFRMMIENASDVIAILNRNGTLRYVSPAFEKIFGYEVSDAIGQEPFQWIHPDDFDAMVEPLAKLMREPNQPIHLHYRIRHRNGSWRYLETIVVNLLDRPEIKGFMSNSRDITDKKLSENELKRSEEKFRLMLEHLTDVINILDADGKIIYESPFREEDASERPVGLINQNALNYIHPEDLPGVLEVFAQGMNNPNLPVKHTFRSRSKKGEWRYLEATGVNLLANPAVQGLVITTRDVTEQKLLEEEKEKMQKQLLQGHKMEALGTLAGGIAHDFNNILGSIIGFTELALMESSPETMKGSLKEVLEAGHRAKMLVQQILAFSRQGIEEREPINVGSIIREVLTLLRPTLPQNVVLLQKLEVESAMMLGDATQIHQVLMNLCSNALNAMKDRGGVLEVSLEALNSTEDYGHQHEYPAPQSYLEITVRDTGHGISQEILERIFDPYFTTKRKGEGTGLGLAVVQGIVKRHNGFIKVASEVGRGTVFHIYLPRVDSKIEEPQPETMVINLGRGRESILFVDDDAGLVTLWRRFLEKLGYQVIGKTNSVEALELFMKKPHDFDLVITDQVMPYITGMELAQAMIEKRPDTRIILCTGFSEGVDAEQVKMAGIKGFIFKPMTIETMSKIIREVLE